MLTVGAADHPLA